MSEVPVPPQVVQRLSHRLITDVLSLENAHSNSLTFCGCAICANSCPRLTLVASDSPLSSLSFTKVPLTTVFASVSMASISFPQSTTTKLKFRGDWPFGVMVAVPVQSAAIE